MDIILVLKILTFAVICSCAFIDIKLKKIPNTLVIVLFALGVTRMIIQRDYISCLIGIVFPSVILLLLRICNSRYIGFGDIKIVMAAGSFYGYIGAGIIVLVSLTMLFIYALIQKRRGNGERSVCYGPFLAVACLLGFL